jgi:hypothetical protein
MPILGQWGIRMIPDNQTKDREAFPPQELLDTITRTKRENHAWVPYEKIGVPLFAILARSDVPDLLIYLTIEGPEWRSTDFRYQGQPVTRAMADEWYRHSLSRVFVERSTVPTVEEQLIAARALLLKALPEIGSEALANEIRDALCPGWRCEACGGKGFVRGNVCFDRCPVCDGSGLSEAGLKMFGDAAVRP